MAAMGTKRANTMEIDWRADWWLWPSALILALTGGARALWMWENTPPDGLAPLWLLLWLGVCVAGVTLPVYWLAQRWVPAAWLAMVTWLGVPAINNLAARSSQVGPDALDTFAPLLLLLLLGVGLSGLMLTLTWYLAHKGSSALKGRPLRQAFWSGFFVVVCGWLLINRAFTLAAVVFLAGALALLEAFLVMRESAPKKKKSDA
jgi:hypothetical protein